MLSAAFAFLSEMVPSLPKSEPDPRVVQDMKQRLAECVERDEEGRMKLTVTLPDESSLSSLADSLARFVSAGSPTTE